MIAEMKYKIVDIKHSGRKGDRYTQVEDPRYKPLFGAEFIANDICSVKQYNNLQMYLINNNMYDWWQTSAVLQISRDIKTHNLIVETINTIYELEELSKNGRSKN